MHKRIRRGFNSSLREFVNFHVYASRINWGFLRKLEVTKILYKF